MQIRMSIIGGQEKIEEKSDVKVVADVKIVKRLFFMLIKSYDKISTNKVRIY